MIHPFSFELKPSRPFPHPRTTPLALWMLRSLSGIYLRASEGVRSVLLDETSKRRLTEAFLGHQKGDHRLILAFRHIHKADAAVMANIFCTRVGRWGRRFGMHWVEPPHVRFLYGKNVLNWAGAGARFLFPRMGGIPVLNRLTDAKSIRALQETAREGRYPIALAPEGQITYHAHHVYDTGHGTAAIARWANQGSLQAGGNGKVVVVPLALRYEYRGRKVIGEVLGRLRDETAFAGADDDVSASNLIAASHHVFDVILNSFDTHYSWLRPGELDEKTSFDDKVALIVEWSLRIGEGILGTSSADEPMDRLFRIRTASYARMFHDPRWLADSDSASQHLAALSAEEASLALARSEIVDLVQYFREDYLTGKPSINRRAEFALNLYDLLNRSTGGDIQNRLDPKGKRVTVRVGAAIDASHVGNKGSIKKEIRKLSHSVKAALEDLVSEEGFESAVD